MEVQEDTPPNSESFRLALRVRHPSMDPDELSLAFRIEPEHAFRAGASRPSTSGLATVSVHAETYWLGVLKPLRAPTDVSFPGEERSRIAQKQLAAAHKSLSWALSLSAARFLTTHADLLSRIRAEGGEVALLVTIYSGELTSFTVPPEASRLFGKFGITLEFELVDD
jgi:hypothetical protein